LEDRICRFVVSADDYIPKLFPLPAEPVGTGTHSLLGCSPDAAHTLRAVRPASPSARWTPVRAAWYIWSTGRATCSERPNRRRIVRPD